MNARTQDVLVGDATYQMRRLAPAVGSYIWQKLAAGCYRAQAAQEQSGKPVQEPSEAEAEAAKKAKPEEKMRTICGMAFMHLDFKDLEFTEFSCMKAVSRMEGEPLRPIPIMADDGRWAAHDIEDNPMLVTRLTVEVLVFNLSPFLAESGV